MIGVVLMWVAIGLAAASGLLLLWMVAATRRAWRTLPPGALVPVHGGPTGWDRWQPKERALFVWPIGGAVVWLINVGIAVYIDVAGGKSAAAADVLTAVLVIPVVILAVSQQLALRAARSRAGLAARAGARRGW